jgi:hypothetical protein
MLTDDPDDYYASRRQAAVEMAKSATEPSIRNIHLEFARRYADLAGEPYPLFVKTSVSTGSTGDSTDRRNRG